MIANKSWFLVLTLFIMLPPVGSGCGGDGDADADADSDVDGDADDVDGGGDADSDADMDEESDADEEQVPTPAHAPQVLILDQEFRHYSTWVDLMRAFEAAGLDVRYRRFYPHLTNADVAPNDEGVVPNSIVVLAAGRTPGNPGSVMRLAELEAAERFVREGGALLLVPQSGHWNSYSGENDFFIFNRLLESLEVPVRIERNTVVGQVFFNTPPIPHHDTDWAYATPLEFNIGYPYLLTPDHDSIVGGMLPTLRVDSTDVEVLLHTWNLGFIWLNLQGAPEDEILEDLWEERAVATLSRGGSGYVAVVPRGPLTVTTASSISDKPAMDPTGIEANIEWMHDLAVQLRELVDGEREHEVTWTREGDQLFSVAAAGIEPLDPSGDVRDVMSEINTLAVPEEPPEGELYDEILPPPPDPRQIPHWFSTGGGRVAYGSVTESPSTMRTAFSELVNYEVDVLMTTTNPVRLTTLDGDALANEEARYVEIAELAEEGGARWFVGEHYVGPYLGSDPRSYPSMVGSHGGAGDSPAPLNAEYWEDFMIPTCAAVGELAAENPGIAGLHFDMELYNGPVWHHDGWAFSDDTVEAFGNNGGDETLASDLLELPAARRLDHLVDAGALNAYFDVLEDAAYQFGARCREAAREHAPDLDLMIYNAGFPSTWFHIGMLRGLGADVRPVIVLTYDGWSHGPTQALWAEGVNFVHLGGTIVSHWSPDHFEDVLVSLAQGNDGYWYFTFNDFSSTNPDPPALHGDQGAYWGAVRRANERLDRGH